MNLSEIIPFIVESITEFLPVSSAAHLFILSNFQSVENINPSNIGILHIIPGLVIISYFRNDIVELLCTFFKIVKTPIIHMRNVGHVRNSKNFRFFSALFLGSLPVLIAGLIMGVFGIDFGYTKKIIGINSIIFGVLLGFFDLVSPKISKKEWGPGSGIFFGFTQILALIPGVSRLGITLTTARALGFERESCARFSFICSIPILLSAGIYNLLKQSPINRIEMSLSFVLVLLASALLGYFVLYLFMRYLRKRTLLLFSIYRIVLGILLLSLNFN